MSTPAVADIEALLAPISGENSAGENLKNKELYDKIKKKRQAGNPLEYLERPEGLAVPDWPAVVELAVEALSARTKDLQIAAWLAEAWMKHGRIDRLAGLREGLILMRGLLDRYWDNLYPAIDPEDDEGPLTSRGNIFGAMAGERGSLSIAIQSIPLTEGTGGARYSYSQWSKKNEAAPSWNDPEKQQRYQSYVDRGLIERAILDDEWNKAKASSKPEFCHGRLALLDECRNELKALDRVMVEKFGRETPGLRGLEKAIEDVHSLVAKMVKEKSPIDGGDNDGGPGTGDGAGIDDGLNPDSGSIATRRDALRLLGRVAEFFRRTEPHSPVSYLLQRAVRWGEMPLDQWLGEVVKDSTVLENLREMLGVKPPDDGQQ